VIITTKKESERAKTPKVLEQWLFKKDAQKIMELVNEIVDEKKTE
jgi:hypothetical protein